MSTEPQLVEKLTILNRIAESLNRAVDVRSMLDRTLADLVELIGLETAWISLQDRSNGGRPTYNKWVLAAHHNLPPALEADNGQAWKASCACRELFNQGSLTEGYNEVHCSRLRSARGDRRGLAVHASVPLRSGDSVLGILNVAAPDWASFSPQDLSLLTNVGNQMGVALERAQLYDLLQERHVHQEQALLHFSSHLLDHLDLDDLIGYLVEQVRQILYADACALLLPSDEQGFLEFRSSKGWHQDPGAERRRVPSDETSGPGLVMRTQQPLLVADLRQHDPTPWAPAWLQAEEFRGHTVVPLLVGERSIGVLVINQRQPQLLPQDDLSCLRLMANQAAVAIETARLLERELKVQALEKELEVGRQIQLSLLPKAPPVVPGWEFASFYQPAREVGGDFYDFFDLSGSPGRLGMVIADVTGKGVPAALFMARSSRLIRHAGLQVGSPAAALVQANDSILEEAASELLLTAAYAELDTRNGQMTYANAGHCRPLWFQAATGRLQELTAQGIILGVFPGPELRELGIRIEEREISVEPGDLLVFYTDGVTEAMDEHRQRFGEERLWATLGTCMGASAQDVLEAIVAAVRAFTGDIPQSDDLTLLVMRRSPVAAPHLEESDAGRADLRLSESIPSV